MEFSVASSHRPIGGDTLEAFIERQKAAKLALLQNYDRHCRAAKNAVGFDEADALCACGCEGSGEEAICLCYMADWPSATRRMTGFTLRLYPLDAMRLAELDWAGWFQTPRGLGITVTKGQENVRLIMEGRALRTRPSPQRCAHEGHVPSFGNPQVRQQRAAQRLVSMEGWYVGMPA